jgi:hypothetical protein
MVIIWYGNFSYRYNLTQEYETLYTILYIGYI